MARRFRPTRKGYAAELEPGESRLVAMLARDVDQLLAARESEHVDAGLKRSQNGIADQGQATGTDQTTSTDQATTAETGLAQDQPSDQHQEHAWWEELGLSNDLFAEVDLESHSAPAALSAPEDAALAALLPAPVAQEDATGALDGADSSMRARTEPDLVERKREGLQWLARAVMNDPMLIPHDRAGQAAASLNDIRLVLAARLGVEDSESAERVTSLMDSGVDDDPEHGMAVLYGFVSWLQDSLMHALLRGKS